MTTKILSGIVVVLALLGAVAFFGFSPFMKAVESFGSPAGSNFSLSKTSGQEVTLATTTTFSQFNGDASARIIKAANFGLYGGTSTSTAYQISCATSTSAVNLNGNTNYILNASIAAINGLYGTTTATGLYVASSSPGITGVLGLPVTLLSTTSNAVVTRLWPSQTYLDCQVTTGDGYNAFNAGTAGTMEFTYIPQ